MTYTSPDYATQANAVLNESPRHAICWASVLSGVFVALAVTITLTILGSGLGLSIKPFAHEAGPSAKTLRVAAVIWMILVQWIASALGGYMTGRLRTRWVSVHSHEVFFRDTAHGFVTWATATVIMVLLLASAATSMGHMKSHMMAHPIYAHAANQRADNGPPPMGPDVLAYYTDSLFRGDRGAAAGTEDVRGEANQILMRGLRNGGVSEEDKTYLAQLVSSRTGLSDTDARKRVDDVIAREDADASQMREVAENARKSAATLAICIALSLLIGAFVSSIAAALGGNIRDRHN